MRVPGKLNKRAICDVFQFVQQLGGIGVLVSVRKAEVSISLSKKMAVERDRPTSKGQSALSRAPRR